MKKAVLLIVFLLSLLITDNVLAQTLEFGPLVGYHRTAFQKPDSSTIVFSGNSAGKGSTTTETDANIAFGGYVAYYAEKTYAFIGEVYYVTTSTPNYATDGFQSINLIPSIAAELGNSNLYVNIGAGAGFLLNEPDFSNVQDVAGIDYKSVDFLVKGALNFRIKEILTLDGGVLMGFTDVVDDINRFHFYLGARVPLNLLLNK